MVNFINIFMHKFLIQTLFQQLFLQLHNYVVKAAETTFVQKIRKFNVDEIDTKKASQFICAKKSGKNVGDIDLLRVELQNIVHSSENLLTYTRNYTLRAYPEDKSRICQLFSFSYFLCSEKKGGLRFLGFVYAENDLTL